MKVFGITVIESGNHSLPLICSNIKIFREITGKNTLLFNPTNEENLAKKIKETIENRFLRKKKLKVFHNFVNKNMCLEKSCFKRSYY